MLLNYNIAASSSPMQISPTSTSSTTVSSTTTTSLSTSSRHNTPAKSGQGVQRSASSCDAENRPGPIKRLKPTLSIEPSSSSTATAIATIKKYTPPIRRPLTTIITPARPVQSKPLPSNKQRSSPMDTTSIRSTRSLSTSNNSSNTRMPTTVLSKTSNVSPAKQTIVTRSPSSSPPPAPPPPPPRPTTILQRQRLSVFGEQFSDDILKTNLLWINPNELDDESRTEVLIQFGSMEKFLHEQQLFTAKQQQQLKLAAKNKTVLTRSRYQLLIPKKDRLELL